MDAPKMPSKQDIIDCIGNTRRWKYIVENEKRSIGYIKTCQKLASICWDKHVNTDLAIDILTGKGKAAKEHNNVEK